MEEKAIIPQLIALALPVMVTQALFMLYDLVDAFWVGRLGVTAPAAIALAGTLNWVLMVLGELIAAGSMALVARFWGSGNKKEARHVALQSLLIAVLFAVIVGTAIFMGAGRIFGFYGEGISEETRLAGTVYLKYIAVGLALSYVYGAITAVLQASGDTVTPMKLGIASNLINIILDPILIFGWGPFPAMGVSGAGLATVIGMAVYLAGACHTVFVSSEHMKITLRGARADLGVIRKILWIGFPSALYGITRPLTGMLMYRLTASFGDSAVAAFGIGGRVWSIASVFLAGFFVATASVVGRLLGAGKAELARIVVTKSVKVSSGVGAVFTLLTIAFARNIIGVFLKDPAAVSAGAAYLRIVGLGFLLQGVSNPLSGVFKGAGHNWPTLIAAFIGNWLCKVPLAYLLAYTFSMGSNGIWWAISASMVIETAYLVFAYCKGRWAQVKI